MLKLADLALKLRKLLRHRIGPGEGGKGLLQALQLLAGEERLPTARTGCPLAASHQGPDRRYGLARNERQLEIERTGQCDQAGQPEIDSVVLDFRDMALGHTGRLAQLTLAESLAFAGSLERRGDMFGRVGHC